jgi:hypothetical protein
LGLHYFQLPLHSFPLLTVDIGLNGNDREYQETQRINSEELNALGQIGNKDANEKQSSQQNPANEKNAPQSYWEDFKRRITVKGALIVAIGFVGVAIGLVVFWHSLPLFFGEDNCNTKTLDRG